VHLVAHPEEVTRGAARRRVLGALDLLHHHLALSGELGGVEARKPHGIGEHVQPLAGELRRHHRVVDRVVERGPRVDLAAVRLDVAGDLSGAAALGSLEQHVLVEVRQAGLVGPLVGAAHVDPDLPGHHVGGPLVLVEDGQAVVESMAGGHVGWGLVGLRLLGKPPEDR